MIDALSALVYKYWLVAAVALFALILLRTFRPSSREQMKAHANIPFLIKDEDDGRA
ncbi:MAG: CcoQ/FixQ family Cbb3-type cytochrome c oxidase assembly chaperone [Tistrella sp.]|uniref:CcoQ/FixQ family Cbb3-type cytochrome c oxidase assembly chaperone n=1 Tax=Tistrella mobilis TaxID=171437 RepID=A0A3B9IJZ5_9PROT|nr:cbb3-type cytochrome c oxidase subunit 3 [Tistrella sp.]MAD39464.1 CcoQ/FixQ family Cbb3-type cytochrome c oxidase assembly chaperone [Tistrella sp.]MBA74809.1 CcoQ/FixQ family Cbb3-type cytochrome c oxidase assembly chaperone [Tistrella sp.]HAE48192.1 CcoQ/FixQ family Cbb3-type cytochrome c oxidase assembly chaperone [Tistrella mobilis]